MKIVSVITDPGTVDRIIAHRQSGGTTTPSSPAAPRAISLTPADKDAPHDQRLAASS
jgi:hypothetical protein